MLSSQTRLNAIRFPQHDPFFRMALAAGTILALLFFAAPAHAVTITLDANCSLTEAIKSANGDSTPSGSTCEPGSGADTISFSTITQVTLLAALDNITSDITIQGGTNVSIDGGSNHRHFVITSGGKLTLNNIILNNGKSSQDGGSIYVASGGRLTLTKVTLGNAESGGRGGGIFIASGASATIQGKSRIHNNEAVNGGGIYSLGSLTIIDSWVYSNNAKTIGSATGEHGAGIHIAGGSATIRGGSKIYSNTAEVEHGGGIYILAASATISNSSIYNNIATKDGGGIYVGTGGSLNISNSTVAKNTAATQGGGILYAAGASSYISHVTIMENVVNTASTSAGTGLHVSARDNARNLRLRNSIIASSDTDNADCYSSREIGQYVGNLVRQQQCWAAANGDPNLDTSNEPNSYTPNSGSPALGIGNASICQQYPRDQLGVRRPATGCDAGSVELGGENWIYVDSDCTLNDAIKAANTNNSVSNSGCEAGKGGGALDVIWLRQNVTLSANLPNVTESVRIEGSGRSVDGGGSYDMFKLTTTINLTINNATLRNARATNEGGAISNGGGTITVTNVIFDSNTSPGSGGAIDLDSGTITVDRSAFLSNVASFTGGAVDVSNGTLTITNSTFFDNRTTNHGGAIYINGGTATLAHLTLWNNRNTHAGGDWIDAIRAGGTTNMYNTIIGRDSASSHKLCGGGFNDSTTARGNLIHNPASTDGCPQATEGDPRLGGLTGGFMPLGAGSKAIGAGRPATCALYPTDQRGASRSLNNCDIGAVQFFSSDSGSSSVGVSGEYVAPDDGADAAGAVCTGELLNSTGSYRITVSYGLCSGIQFNQLQLSAIGIGYVVEAGPLDAIDVWGWVTSGVEVCFKRQASTLFLDAANSPRTIGQLASTWDGEWTCADIDRAGTIVLMPADSYLTTAPADVASPGVAAAMTPLADCMVELLYALNFRETPGGTIMMQLPHRIRLTAFQRTAEWVEVDYHGTRGWLSAGHVTFVGSC